ncbi:unnamed protein product [Ixodes pacificus]
MAFHLNQSPAKLDGRKRGNRAYFYCSAYFNVFIYTLGVKNDSRLCDLYKHCIKCPMLPDFSVFVCFLVQT